MSAVTEWPDSRGVHVDVEAAVEIDHLQAEDVRLLCIVGAVLCNTVSC